jgi:predicted AAA+ superfamily ATPase
MDARDLEKPLRKLATQYPAVTLLGSLQSGKTTLVKQCFPDHTYVNLEEPDTRAFAQSDPRRFLNSNGKTILDEIQQAPELLSYIQSIVDNDPEKGRFV